MVGKDNVTQEQIILGEVKVFDSNKSNKDYD
jgi:hypothetical protein